nr:hypothetical protein [Candidatus Sigynarchaeota archaeon]
MSEKKEPAPSPEKKKKVDPLQFMGQCGTRPSKDGEKTGKK